MSRFGLQPAALVLKQQRWTRPAIADRINVPYSHLVNAVTGKTVPSPALRERLPIVLGVPLTRLFSAEALAEDFTPTSGPGTKVSRAAAWRTEWAES